MLLTTSFISVLNKLIIIYWIWFYHTAVFILNQLWIGISLHSYGKKHARAGEGNVEMPFIYF